LRRITAYSPTIAMRRTASPDWYSGIPVVLVTALEEVILTVEVVRAIEEVAPFDVEERVVWVELVMATLVVLAEVAWVVEVVVVLVVVLLFVLMKSSLMFVPVNDTVFVIAPKLEPEAVTVIVPEALIGNA